MNPTGAGPGRSEVPQADHFYVEAREERMYYDPLISWKEPSGCPNAHKPWADRQLVCLGQERANEIAHLALRQAWICRALSGNGLSVQIARIEGPALLH
jgi:hypothetical protein